MSRICRITPRASQDIEEIADYLAIQNSLASAETFLSGVNSALQRIAQFPQIGRKRDELGAKSSTANAPVKGDLGEISWPLAILRNSWHR